MKKCVDVTLQKEKTPGSLNEKPSPLENNNGNTSDLASYDFTATQSNKPHPSLSFSNNNFHSGGYFYSTQLSPIYEPDTESICSSNDSPIHLHTNLTNVFLPTNQCSLYNNNNKYINDQPFRVDDCDSGVEMSFSKSLDQPKDVSPNDDIYIVKDSGVDMSFSKSLDQQKDVSPSDDIKDGLHNCDSKSSHICMEPSEDVNVNDNERTQDNCNNEKRESSSISFKSVLSAINASKKLSKLRTLQQNISESTLPPVPPIITINNDAIISSPFKSRFMSHFTSASSKNSTKDDNTQEEGEVDHSNFCCLKLIFSFFFSVVTLFSKIYFLMHYPKTSFVLVHLLSDLSYLIIMQPLLLSSFFRVKLLVKFYFMKTRENFFRIAFYFMENKLIVGIELFSPSRWLKINSACFLFF